MWLIALFVWLMVVVRSMLLKAWLYVLGKVVRMFWCIILWMVGLFGILCHSTVHDWCSLGWVCRWMCCATAVWVVLWTKAFFMS